MAKGNKSKKKSPKQVAATTTTPGPVAAAPSAQQSGETAKQPSETPKQPSETPNKIVLIVLETVVIGTLSFLLGQYYDSMKKFRDIRFETQDATINRGQADEYLQKKIFVYRLGEPRADKEPPETADGYFGIVEDYRDCYKIAGEPVVGAYERSVTDLFTEPEASLAVAGGPIAPDDVDPDESRENLFSYHFADLSPSYVYQITVNIKPEKVSPPLDAKCPDGKSFKILFVDGDQVSHEIRMGTADYLRVYVTQLLILGMMALAALALVIWKVGGMILKRPKGAMR